MMFGLFESKDTDEQSLEYDFPELDRKLRSLEYIVLAGHRQREYFESLEEKFKLKIAEDLAHVCARLEIEDFFETGGYLENNGDNFSLEGYHPAYREGEKPFVIYGWFVGKSSMGWHTEWRG